MPTEPFDPLEVQTISATEMPQKLIFEALMTSKKGGLDPTQKDYAEDECGREIVRHYGQLSQKDPNYGLFTPFDHPSISFRIKADHSTLSQLILNSTQIAFNLEPLVNVGKNLGHSLVEDEFHVRHPGNYPDSFHYRNPWTEECREEYLAASSSAVIEYQQRNKLGMDQAESLLPMNILQSVTASGNLRSWLRLLDVNSRPHNSYEMKSLIQAIADEVSKWSPGIYRWWSNNYRSRQDLSLT